MSTDQNTQEPTLAMIMAKLEVMDQKLDVTNSDLQAFKQKTAEDLECQERHINKGNVLTAGTTCARTEERPPVFNLPDDPFGRNVTTSKPPRKPEELPYYCKEQTNEKNAYSDAEEFLNAFERAIEADDISLDLYGPKWLLARLRAREGDTFLDQCVDRKLLTQWSLIQKTFLHVFTLKLNTHIFMEKLQRLKLSPKDDIITFTNTFDDLRKKAGQEPNMMFVQDTFIQALPQKFRMLLLSDSQYKDCWAVAHMVYPERSQMGLFRPERFRITLNNFQLIRVILNQS
ncbi:hypothetical protein H4219_006332 [Mycoemilia scoparia]|uniref:Retrotransposon gag domain-containing protein n=1 Tax=Mycoemilia scoparia TaxID=417184 RepID=A0A9W8DIZ7_9FUNG|nr:hypothetical protein H4219_006332 [Mycoemilia scoparia]